MSNIFQTNSFAGGMNMDTDIMLLPNTQYRYAENVRIITNDDGNTGMLQNIQDTLKVEGDIFEREGEKVLAVVTVDKYIIALTSFPFEGKTINSIYRISNYNNPPLTSVTVVSGELGYTESSSIKLVANYESDTNIKLYIADGEHYIRVISLMDNRYVYEPGVDNPLLDINGFITNPDFLDMITNSTLTPPTLNKLGTGNLKTGMVQYAYQLFNARGNESLISPISGLVHLTTSDGSESLNDYKGSEKNVNSNKSVIINIPLSYEDNLHYGYLYDYIRVYRIFYKDRTELPTIEITGEVKIPTNVDEITYEDNGNSTLSTITLEEFNSVTNVAFIPATIEKKDNRLFAANTVIDTWNPTYDARAYRTNKDGKLILKDSISSRNISQVLPTDEAELKALYESIPEDHDCINPYNTVKGQPSDEENCQYSNIWINPDQHWRGKYLGGSGLNISYRFVYTMLDLDKMGSIYSNVINGDQTKIDIPSFTSSDQYRMYFNWLDNDSPMGIEDINSVYQLNFADPNIDSRYKGYQRDEIYRFGIVLYNSKNVASPVHWIGDIRMPHAKDYPAFFAGEYLFGRTLGVYFDVQNLPEDVVSYEIVRCERTASDRTVVMQSVLSQITSYPYKYLDAGDQLATDQDGRPCIPLRYRFSASTFGALEENRSSGMSRYNDGQLLSTFVRKNYGALISPELDINGDSMLSYMKNCYLDHLYILHSEKKIDTTDYSTASGTFHPKYGVFLATADTVQTYTNARYPQNVLAGSACNINSEIGDSTLILQHTGIGKFIPNLIAKRYIPYHSGDYVYDDKGEIVGYKRLTVDIEDNAIFPQILEQNAITNKGAYYQSIGDISYLNLAHVRNDEEQYSDTISKACYFGKCAIVQGKNDFTDTFNSVLSPNTEHMSANNILKGNLYGTGNYGGLWDIPVVNIKRDIIPYNGNTYVARTNSTYVSTGYFKIVGDTSNPWVFGGDTYLGILDHRTGSIWPNPEIGGGDPDNTQMSMTDFIPFETSINLNLQYGDTTSRSCEGDRTYTDVYLSTTITGGTLGNYHIQSKPYYAYNDAYSAQSNAKYFVPSGMYSKDSTINNNRILYSELKTNDEISDSFSQFKVANYLDVDSQYGSVTNLKSFNNSLYFWQDSSLGIAAVNERSLIQDNNVGGLTLGTGDVLSRYDYVTTGNGSSIVNDPSIIDSGSALYWFDKDKNEICQLANGINKISKENTVQSWLNLTPRSVHDALYDNKFNELQFCFDDVVLVYNERTRGFTSFYTFVPDKHASFSDKLLYIKDKIFKENADFQDSTMTCKIKYVVNDNPNITKTFDNVYFGGYFTNIDEMLTDINFETKHQRGQALEDDYTGTYAIDYREDTYRFAIGREENATDPYSYPGRLRGKYLICEFIIDCNDQKEFNLLNVNTTYRQSLV